MQKMFRIAICKFALGLTCSALSFSCFAARPEDAQCKSDPFPLGFLPISELNSPDCENGSNPFVLNAWIFDRAKDGISVCQPPDFQNGFPPAISYPVVKAVILEKCPQKLDGGPNAFKLGTPESVRDMHKTKYLEDFKVAPFCFDGSTEQKKLLANILNTGFVDGNAPLTIFVTQRLFFSNSCPAVSTQDSLNAVIVQRFESGESLLGKILFACKLSLADPNIIKDPDWSRRIKEFHDDKCGSGDSINSVNISYPSASELGR